MLTTAITPEMHYDDWAGAYEKDAMGWGYCAHKKIAQKIEKSLQFHKSTPKVLDIGIGTGLVSQGVRKSRCDTHITGIDVSSKMLEVCRRNGAADDLHKVNISSDRFPFKDNSFDYTVSAGVMENVENIGNAIQEMGRVTKPGGIMAFTYVPAEKSPMRDLMSKRFRPGVDEGGKRIIGDLTLYAHNARKIKFFCKAVGVEPLSLERFVGYRTFVLLTVKYDLFIGRKL